MKKTIQEYTIAKNLIFNLFGCPEEFPVNPRLENKWSVSRDEGLLLLTYWNENNAQKDFAVAKKDGEPMIYSREDYVMVVAIDCIKTAFVFQNTNMVH